MSRGLWLGRAILWAVAAVGAMAPAGMPVTVIPSMQGAAVGATSTAQSWTAGPYAYDGAGNIKTIGTDRFTYDRVGRLVTAQTAGARSSHAYDRFGNLTAMTVDGTTVTLGPDPATNRITNTTGASGTPANYGTYDAAGRVTALSDGSSYTWDAIGMMVSSSGLGGSNRKVYVYTASDERIASIRVNGTAEGASEWTLRDTGGKVLRRIERAGPGASWVWREDYVYAGDRLLASEIDSAPRTLHYFHDHLGSPRLVTGNGGMKAAGHTYFPFGAEAPPPVVQTATMAADYDRLRFTGHERDASQLDYMHARYYSPGVGRFLSVDPGRDWDPRKPQSWNMYAYVRNNPINTMDPTGKWGWSDFKEWVRDTRTDISNWWHNEWHDDIPAPADQYDAVAAGEAADLTPEEAQELGKPQARWANARAEAGAILSDEATTEAMSWGVGKIAGAAVVVIFSKQAIGHGARHLAGSGLSDEVVEGAIEREIQFVGRESSQTGSFWGRITVEGRTIQFKAHTLPDGRINVGTYWETGD
jgi:RHS repeat-associated protein